jgi:ribosomal protein S18 acetylase RimI-like enzyme
MTDAMKLRTAQPADATAVSEVHVRSWQIGYRGLVSQTYLDRMRPEERAERYTFGEFRPDRPHTIVALQQDVICGFVTTGLTRDDDLPDVGELFALHVDPEHWGHGTGRALLQHARTHLIGHGFTQAVLWVFVGNDRAQSIYQADGWMPEGLVREERFAGEPVSEERLRRALP